MHICSRDAGDNRFILVFTILNRANLAAVTRGAEVLIGSTHQVASQLNVTIVHSFFVARARALFYQEVRISARQEVARNTCGSSTASRITSEEE